MSKTPGKLFLCLALLVLASHLFYAFQGRQLWLGFDWVLVTTAAVVSILVMVRLERDRILSHLWSTNPGKISWDGNLVRQIVLYGVIPILTLFPIFFPEVGGAISNWLQIGRTALP